MDNSDSKNEMTRLLRLNEPAVIADDIDGEIVIMNLERGSYYGLDAVGTDIWRMIIAGRTGQETASRVASHFDADIQRVRSDIAGLIAKVLEHELLVADVEISTSGKNADLPITAGQYNAPELTVYSDMKDLLAFDPPLPTYDPVSGK